MNPLRLSPLPTNRADADPVSLRFEREGFVDEAVVTALCRGQSEPLRSVANEADLALAADDLDFAGWRPFTLPPQVRPAEQSAMPAVVQRRPAAPMMQEPGLGPPHRGRHRWWLAGLAGALSTLVFSLLLINLSTRVESGFADPSASKPVRVDSPELAGNKQAAEPPAAELTEVSRLRP